MSYPLRIIGFLLSAVLVTAGYLWCTRPELQYWRGFVTHGDASVRAVALTFDDGPHPLWTPLLAETLERHGARGTFFVVGVEAQKYPELIARLARGGHQVANHSHTHPYPNLTALPPEEMRAEMVNAQALLRQFSDQPVLDFRPPGGGVNFALLREARARGLRIAWWSSNAGDAAYISDDLLADRLRRRLRPGQVMLLHQRGHTVQALERLLASPEAADYTYDTFSAVTR